MLFKANLIDWLIDVLMVLIDCTEEYIVPDMKMADCLYQCEKFARSNHLSNREPKLLFKVLSLLI